MSVRLEEQIRRYTEAIDFIAAPVEELIPGDMASKLDIESGNSIDIRVSFGPPKRGGRFPGWAYGFAAAVLVLLLAIPVWYLMSSPVDDVADITTTAVPVPPPESADSFLRAESDGVVTGVGWLPSSPITFTVDGSEGDESFDSDAAGRFNFPLASIGLRFEPGDTLTASDGNSKRQILIPIVAVDTFEPGLGVASGTASLPDGTPMELRIPVTVDDEVLARFQTTVRAGAWSFTFEPIAPEQITAEAWISIHSGDGPYEIRLIP